MDGEGRQENVVGTTRAWGDAFTTTPQFLLAVSMTCEWHCGTGRFVSDESTVDAYSSNLLNGG
jgi:hypothetical protein